MRQPEPRPGTCADTDTLVATLAGLVTPRPAPAPAPGRADVPRAAEEPVVLADRPDGTVVRVGDRVVKAHPADSDPAALGVRLRVAAHPSAAGCLLAPLPPAGAVRLTDGRPVTLWPCGVPVDPDAPEEAPWEAAGELLARLHRLPPGALRRSTGPLPPMRGPAKATSAVARMRAAAEGTTAAAVRAVRDAVEGAWATLPAWCRGEGPPPAGRSVTLCHGDFHLGQLVRHPGPRGPWRLIDIDDLGLGDPAWDLARPAAWYASGLLPPRCWARFLGSYRSAAGGLPATDDPWPWLDAPARALTVQSAAVALAKALDAGRPLEEDEWALVDSCNRIVELPPADGS